MKRESESEIQELQRTNEMVSDDNMRYERQVSDLKDLLNKRIQEVIELKEKQSLSN